MLLLLNSGTSGRTGRLAVVVECMGGCATNDVVGDQVMVCCPATGARAAAVVDVAVVVGAVGGTTAASGGTTTEGGTAAGGGIVTAGTGGIELLVLESVELFVLLSSANTAELTTMQIRRELSR